MTANSRTTYHPLTIENAKNIAGYIVCKFEPLARFKVFETLVDSIRIICTKGHNKSWHTNEVITVPKTSFSEFYIIAALCPVFVYSFPDNIFRIAHTEAQPRASLYVPIIERYNLRGAGKMSYRYFVSLHRLRGGRFHTDTNTKIIYQFTHLKAQPT